MSGPRRLIVSVGRLVFSLSLFFTASADARVVADFRDLVMADGDDVWNGSDGSGGFNSRAVRFHNQYNPDWGAWSGFAYSRVNDPETPGWDNQYAVISGTGVGGTGIYAIAYTQGDARVTLPVAATVRGIYVNNTTYAALDMEQGSAFSKPFGGATGDDPDWFLLTVHGYEADGTPLGNSTIYLADYRFEDNADNYILRDWAWLCLTNLGPHVATLRFELSSSDVGVWGMNTPAYFALGQLVTDEHYAPAAGQPGSTAVAMDSGTIIGWATGWTNYVPGDHVDPFWQTPHEAVGPASGTTTNIVCLGDGGTITMVFDPPIQDGPGPDFAVFENAFNDHFLELAFVEVSSDGTNFARFFNRSLTPDPVAFMGATVHATNVTGLAGKYRQGFGEPFDLGDIEGAPGIDLSAIRYVRLVDIIGDGRETDSVGHPIYDPHPTELSAGFDLDAIAMLSNAVSEVSLEVTVAEASKDGLSPAVITIRRKAWTADEPLDVDLEFGGTATAGADYVLLDGTITLEAGQTAYALLIQPLMASAGNGDQDVVISIAPSPAYRVGRSARARVHLTDVDDYDLWRLANARLDFETLPLADGADYWNGADGSGGFGHQGVHFSNYYDTDWGSWSGFAYSRVNDTTTPGWANQYAVISGTGLDGHGIYVVAYDAGPWGPAGTITLPVASGILGFYVNNTTWAALDMEQGSAFSKQFGGETGDDPDWFLLTVFGHAADGTPLGSNTIYLADYRFEDNDQNYILRDWTWLSLTNLGPNVKTLTFALASSDIGDWGMNTPAYFALDGVRLDPDGAGLAPESDWSGDGIVNLMAFALGRHLDTVQPGSTMTPRVLTDDEMNVTGWGIEFNRNRHRRGVTLRAEVCFDLAAGTWLFGDAHVLETDIGGDALIDRVRATPVNPAVPAFMRLRVLR